MVNKIKIIDDLKSIQEEVFCDYCEYCRLSGDCTGAIDKKPCNMFKKVIEEFEKRLDVEE